MNDTADLRYREAIFNHMTAVPLIFPDGEKRGFIYVWINKVNGNCYIGKTINFKNRTKQHFGRRGGCPIFEAAINKYGSESFVPLVRECRAWAMSDMEIAMIAVFRACGIPLYNITDGGEGASICLLRRGEDINTAKLTAEKVLAIRERYRPGETTATELAAEYGVKACTIGQIVHRRSWKHIGGPPPPPKQMGLCGSRNWSTKLTAEQVREIRTRHASGVTRYRLGKDYGMSQRAITAIVQRETWRNI